MALFPGGDRHFKGLVECHLQVLIVHPQAIAARAKSDVLSISEVSFQLEDALVSVVTHRHESSSSISVEREAVRSDYQVTVNALMSGSKFTSLRSFHQEPPHRLTR